MKTVKDKQVLVAADIAGVPLKDAVVRQLEFEGWEVTDIGVKAGDAAGFEMMFHRIGIRVGTLIAEGEFERALVFCGTGMGIHIAAGKCPHVHAAVVESVPAALRCITGNNCNVLAMGAQYVAPQTGIDCAKAFLEHSLGDGYEWWENFKEFHQLAFDELEAFDYETYKANGFRLQPLGQVHLGANPRQYAGLL